MKIKTGTRILRHEFFLGALRVATLTEHHSYSVVYAPVIHQQLHVSHHLLLDGQQPFLFMSQEAGLTKIKELAGSAFAQLKKTTTSTDDVKMAEIARPCGQGERDLDWITVDNGTTFEGSRAQFQDAFFSNATNPQIAQWAATNQYRFSVNWE